MTRGILSQDVVYALRTMAKSPSFVAVAVVALALGIGSNAAIFTVIDAVLIKTLPYDDPDRMVVLVRTRPAGPSRGVSVPKYIVWRDGVGDVLTDVTVYDSGGPGMSLSTGGDPEQVKAIRVSREFFSLFRAKPALGRFFLPEEDRSGGPRVAVISHALWTRRFGADPGIAGQVVMLNGQPHTIVGVVAAGFEPNPPADVWVALQPDPTSTNQSHFLLGGARLKPGVTLGAANVRMRTAAEEFRRRFPNAMASDESAGVTSMRGVVTGDISPMLLVIWGAVGLVQLIACANVANLLLVRSVARAREMTIRSCLGASRARLLRQSLTEGIVLALVSGVVGVVLGRLALTGLLSMAPPEIPRLSHLTAQGGLDPSVLTFTLLLSVVSGVLFGIVPALQVSRTDLNAGLKDDTGRASAGVRFRRLQDAFVVAELSLALVLLVAAGLLIRSAVALSRVQPGFRIDNVLTFKTSLRSPQYSTTAAVTQYTNRLIERLQGLPGVQAAASVTFLPTEGGPELGFGIEGRPETSPDGAGSGRWRAVSPRLFEALGIPLVRGRVFRDADAAGAAPVVIVNQALARKYWPNESAIGQRITIGNRLGPSLRDATREIVGIVGDTREDGLQVDPPVVIYFPQPQMSDAFTALTNSLVATSWVVSTAGNLRALVDGVRQEMAAADSRQAGFDLVPMRELVQHSIASRRFILALLTTFASVALLLAAIGIYGVFSYALEQRTHEIAIRLALGAGRSQVMSLLLGHGFMLTVVGIAIGLGAAAGLARVLTALLFGVRPTDVQTFMAASLVLAAVAVLATWIPARRATRIDPAISLRYQ